MEQFHHECQLLMDSKWKAFMEVLLRKLNILRSFSSKLQQNNEYLNMKTSVLNRDKEKFESQRQHTNQQLSKVLNQDFMKQINLQSKSVSLPTSNQSAATIFGQLPKQLLNHLNT